MTEEIQTEKERAMEEQSERERGRMKGWRAAVMIEAEREGEGVLITPRMGVLGVTITPHERERESAYRSRNSSSECWCIAATSHTFIMVSKWRMLSLFTRAPTSSSASWASSMMRL